MKILLDIGPSVHYRIVIVSTRKEQRMLPRLLVFRSNRMPINHLVMVDGNVMRPLCMRRPVKNGMVQSPEAEVTCHGCNGRGWTKGLGFFGRSPNVNKQGQYITWEEKARLQAEEAGVS